MNTACAPHCPQVPSILPHCHLGLLSLSICWPRDLAQQNYNRTRFACFVWLGASPPHSPRNSVVLLKWSRRSHMHTQTLVIMWYIFFAYACPFACTRTAFIPLSAIFHLAALRSSAFTDTKKKHSLVAQTRCAFRMHANLLASLHTHEHARARARSPTSHYLILYVGEETYLQDERAARASRPASQPAMAHIVVCIYD